MGADIMIGVAARGAPGMTQGQIASFAFSLSMGRLSIPSGETSSKVTGYSPLRSLHCIFRVGLLALRSYSKCRMGRVGLPAPPYAQENVLSDTSMIVTPDQIYTTLLSVA